MLTNNRKYNIINTYIFSIKFLKSIFSKELRNLENI